MLTKFLAVAMLGSALMAAPALAQTPNKMNNDSKMNNAADNAQKASTTGLWQASKVIGLNVYNEQNEKIGSIVQLMLDKNGTIASVVIGVGGFLGMGERDVAVKFGDLKFSDQPVPSPTGTNTTTRPSTTTGTGSGMSSSASSGPKTYPDHAVFNASKDQLKAMPQFDYNK